MRFINQFLSSCNQSGRDRCTTSVSQKVLARDIRTAILTWYEFLLKLRGLLLWCVKTLIYKSLRIRLERIALYLKLLWIIHDRGKVLLFRITLLNSLLMLYLRTLDVVLANDQRSYNIVIAVIHFVFTC